MQISGRCLRGGRGARRAVKRKRIQRRNAIWRCGMPRNFLRFGNEVERRRGQRRHMQRLANVASGIRSAGVMMQNRAASREIQQREAAEYR